jgi:hypothetical protein
MPYAMTLSAERAVAGMPAKIVEYHFDVSCGTPIVVTEKKATCVAVANSNSPC